MTSEANTSIKFNGVTLVNCVSLSIVESKEKSEVDLGAVILYKKQNAIEWRLIKNRISKPFALNCSIV